MSKSEIASLVEKRIREEFSPEKLEVIDESQAHVGHAGVAATGGAHIRINMSCSSLKGSSRVDQHRKVNSCLKDLIDSNQIHALALRIES